MVVTCGSVPTGAVSTGTVGDVTVGWVLSAAGSVVGALDSTVGTTKTGAVMGGVLARLRRWHMRQRQTVVP